MARIDGTNGNDDMHGTAQADVIYMKDGADKADGWAGADEMHGGGGNDTLNGGDGNDSLYGEAGTDRLHGGAGRDLLVGGADGDYLWGDAGADRFRFTAANAQSSPIDIIKDFSRGDDVIDLSAIDANWNAAGNQAYHLVAGGAFTGHAGELIYRADAQAGNTTVYGDNDGDGYLDFGLQLAGVHQLTAGDFIL